MSCRSSPAVTTDEARVCRLEVLWNSTSERYHSAEGRSAEWYLSLVDFANTSHLDTRASSVVTAGDDLQLNKKVKATFIEDFDGLGACPFDPLTRRARGAELTVTIGDA